MTDTQKYITYLESETVRLSEENKRLRAATAVLIASINTGRQIQVKNAMENAYEICGKISDDQATVKLFKEYYNKVYAPAKDEI